MRRFHSYGPVDARHHFCVERAELRAHCKDNLIGDPDAGGHYFTIWGSRQTGKTWLMRQVREEIKARYGDRFLVGDMSMQGVIIEDDEPIEKFLNHVPRLFRLEFNIEPQVPASWEEWTDLFSKDKGLFERPLILFIDEFDSLPPKLIDRLVALFRDMYLKRKSYSLHGLALIGVRAVLGLESKRGSPFNVQRSLHVPNFSSEEVNSLFQQYQEESEQEIKSMVVSSVFEATRGQPGLVCWFGELLTEKYNPGSGKIIDEKIWERTYRRAINVEWNNTVLNLIKKARTEYQPQVLELFARSDIPFRLDTEWCNYLYLNGVIDSDLHVDDMGKETEICRFSCPFVQRRLYNALGDDLLNDQRYILVLDPFDELEDVFSGVELDLPALLRRYVDYLARLKAAGINPWKEQPRRKTDFHLREAVGHFHLYAWLENAVGKQCVISPEFPTGNGRVDLHLKCGEKRGLIEVKSFTNATEFKTAKRDAAKYALQTGLKAVTIALFVPLEDKEVLSKLSGEEMIENVKVAVTAIGWV